jgi:hypothetical protein
MSEEKLTFKERKQLFIDANTWNKPKRVLLNAYQMGWMYPDAGYTLDIGARDYHVSKVVMDTFMQKYKVDAIGTASCGFRYRFRFTDPLGQSGTYDKSDEKLKKGHVNAIFSNLMGPEDYDALKENPAKVIWEKILFNAFPGAKDMTPEAFARAAQELQFLTQATKSVNDQIREKYGVLIPYPDAVNFSCFIDTLFNQYRGIKEIALDLKRCPEKVYEICEYMDEKNVQAAIAQINALPDGYGAGIANYYDAYTMSLANTILSPKQQERLYIRPWKKFFDACQAKKKTVYCNIEGSFINDAIGEFFGGYDKGTLNITVEMDDPYAVRKKYPNISIFGGLDVNKLGKGTPEECVAMAKRAIDELGMDGGLYLAPNKMVAFSYDMRSDTLKAVADFVSSYYIN